MANLGTLRPGAGNTTGLPTSGSSLIGVPGGSTALSDDSTGTSDGQDTNSSGIYQYGRELADMPSDFLSMDTLSVQVQYGWATTPSNSSASIGIKITASDGTTVLAAANSGGAEQPVVGASTVGIPTNSSVVGFSYVDTGASKSQWDGALIQLYISRSRNKGGDGITFHVYEAWITGTYTASSGETTKFVIWIGNP